MTKYQKILGAALCGMVIFGNTGAAQAKCQTLYFSVNDYGKEGPAKDATDLLDKYIVKWTEEKSIKKYRKVPKDIKCELFLDFIAFDEYTCTASADVCW
jgi:hypothetical protein